MNEEERNILAKLPDQITIYRGMSEKELISKEFGVSWTLDKKTATFFAEKYFRNFATKHHNKIVHDIFINKKDIIAFNCALHFTQGL